MRIFDMIIFNGAALINPVRGLNCVVQLIKPPQQRQLLFFSNLVLALYLKASASEVKLYVSHALFEEMRSGEYSNWKPLRPNILVTGTPGTGKTTISRELGNELGLRHIDVGDFAKDRNLLAEHDVALDFHYMDENAVLDALEPIMKDGGVILDHHSSDWFPERWIQVVVVLRASTEVLYDRLESRQYPKAKLDGNMQAEIMQVARDEAFESYPKATLIEVDNSIEERKGQIVSQVKKVWARIVDGGMISEDVR